MNEPEGDPHQSPGSKMIRNGDAHPRRLWESEIDALSPLLALIVGGIDHVQDQWYAAYAAHFDRRPTLSRPEFSAVFKPHLADCMRALAAGRTTNYNALVGHLGEVLAQRRVPFDEVSLSLRTYEDSVLAAFPESLLRLEQFRIFSRLIHALLAAVAESYFRPSSAINGHAVSPAANAAAGDSDSSLNAIVGASAAMLKLREHIKAAAQVRGTVLLVGESGTGKELVASAIHQSSPAADTPFIAVNCAAIPRDLIESELFGYVKGAFSGANSHFLGLFRSAEKGTLFLDEVTEMSPETQSKILRAIQERTVRPLGSTREIAIDVRLIASTNRDPEEAVRSGQLRQDLYYRLQASVLRVPPLRERVEDIPLLVDHFIALMNARMGRAVPVQDIEPAALNAMREYSWPGNVRELSNAIETAMTFGVCPLIALEDLPPTVTRTNGAAVAVAMTAEPPDRGQPPPEPPSPMTTLEASERELVARALAITGGNKSRAAKLLQISRKKLYSLTNKYMLAARPETNL